MIKLFCRQKKFDKAANEFHLLTKSTKDEATSRLNEAEFKNLPEALKAGGFEEDSFALAEIIGGFYYSKQEYKNALTYY